MPGLGRALNPSNISFHYVDVWSSRFTWGGSSPPVHGDLVHIQKGQTILLDTSTAVLKTLVVDGVLIFDHAADNITLHSELVLVNKGGAIEIGTETRPFLNRAGIMLYGNRLSQELPMYGAKTLAVRHGRLDVHGKPLNVTWTKLASTAFAGANTIDLMVNVDWTAGGEVVIAATGRSQRENEQHTIAAILNGGRRLQLTKPLAFTHIGIEQVIDGVTVATRAEVGYLTRNVVIEGNRNPGWDEAIEACPEEFKAGQFDTQTCFQGRYGAETGSDQFGSHVILFADRPEHGRVVGRFSYVEVRHAGQAFMLGRYPIHYHMSGDVNGSFVRGCAVHNTFNRAFTIHGVHNLLLEDNVAFNNLGHAYFLEDGIETGTIIQRNLGIFTRSSSSLLNVDVTPATFWITNTMNTLRDNAAAGGTHFGYWFRPPFHPEGPSFTSSICVQSLPLLEFARNSAHSFGRYGLWIWRGWTPRQYGLCSGVSSRPEKTAHLLDFVAWNNEVGAEFVNAGAVQLVRAVILDNRRTGVEMTSLKSHWWSGGPALVNSLVVGYSAVSDLLNSSEPLCMTSGVKTPHSRFLSVINTTFVNFNRTKCSALSACSHCKSLDGGFETRFSGIQYRNSPNRIKFAWEHEAVFVDMDGTLSGTGQPGTIVPSSGLYDPRVCTSYSNVLSDSFPAALCDASAHFVRMGWHQASPSSLHSKTVQLTSLYGSSLVPYRIKRATSARGWMAVFPSGQTYQMSFLRSPLITNVSYTSRFHALRRNDTVLIRHRVAQFLDQISTNGEQRQNSTRLPLSIATARNGQWHYQTDRVLMNTSVANGTAFNITYRNESHVTYAVSGANVPWPDWCGCVTLRYKVYRCYYPNCVLPKPIQIPDEDDTTVAPPEFPRSNNTQLWSSVVASGMRDVVINHTQHVIIDVPLVRLQSLTIYGIVEFDSLGDHTLMAGSIFVYGGALLAGNTTHPFQRNLTIILTGNLRTQAPFLANGEPFRSKTLAVFGTLRLIGAAPRVTRTWLNSTVRAGRNRISVMHPVSEWSPGDSIAIAPTGYETREAERAVIASIVDGGYTIVLRRPVSFEHWGGKHDGYYIAAAVVLLSRNIVIDGGDTVVSPDYFGATVYIDNMGYVSKSGRRIIYRASANLVGVEFRKCGQFGFTDTHSSVPSTLSHRAAITLSSRSSMTSCSLHDIYNTAIASYRTRSVTLAGNVVYRTVGTSIRISGSGHRLTENVAMMMLFMGTFEGRNEGQNLDYPSLFDLTNCRNLILSGNVAAGSERVGFRVDGENCPIGRDPTTGVPDIASLPSGWSDNTAHSCLHGVHMGYSDGLIGCSLIRGFTLCYNYNYGLFSYVKSALVFSNLVVYDNSVGMLANSYRPLAIKHTTSNKKILVLNSVIVGAVTNRTCSLRRPAVAAHIFSKRSPRGPGGGNIGFIWPSFSSSTDMAPKSPWHKLRKYPAINGETVLYNVSFVNFRDRCSGGGVRDIAITNNPSSDDAQHPIRALRCERLLSSPVNMFSLFNPNLGLVNPSDCVDMDCDGLKHNLFTDVDGGLTGAAGSTIISKAEFEWGGDRRRGLGDYRIPKALLTARGGRKLNVLDVAPRKGIVRGTGNSSQCRWMSGWNAYMCSNLKHQMMVVESLDADTLVRRLSPVALLADGYIDLLNGPQDHGWCDGYTCQERISTFYGLIAPGREYKLYFSSTGPQRLRLHILNSDADNAILACIYQSSVQRYDIYSRGRLVPATNQKRVNGSLRYLVKNATQTEAIFKPVLGRDRPGANYVNRRTKLLCVIVDGSTPITIQTTPAVVLEMDFPATVTVDDFFERNIINNLAALLGVPKNKIKMVSVTRETSRRRRRATSGSQSIQFEISNDAPETIQEPEMESFNGTSSENVTATTNVTDTLPTIGAPNLTTGANTASTPSVTVTTTSSSDLQITQLQQVLTTFVDTLQRGELSNALNVTVSGAKITEPILPVSEPPPLATNASVATGNSSNLTIAQIQALEEEKTSESESEVIVAIPNRMVVNTHPTSEFSEGQIIPDQPRISILDSNNAIVPNLGLSTSPWRVRASLTTSGSQLLGTTEMAFSSGWANFTDLYVDTPGVMAQIRFDVVYPANLAFSATSNSLTTTLRSLELNIVRHPTSVTSDVLQQELNSIFQVELRDRVSGQRIVNHGWARRRWYLTPTLINSNGQTQTAVSVKSGSERVEFTRGLANISNLILSGRFWHFPRISLGGHRVF